jgi:hypothetical protein
MIREVKIMQRPYGGTQARVADLAAPPAPVAQPRIAANRKRVDDRDPSLGFTIDAAGLPYFEVLLATDPKYFDPKNAGSRSAANFYASRQDSGLIRSTGQHSVYLVPSAVLRGFAGGQPRPHAVYYTVVAYARHDGSGPVLAQAPEILPTAAPSVVLAADFQGHTLAHVLGVPVDKLRVVTGSALDAGDAGAGDFGGDYVDAEGDVGDDEGPYAAEAAASRAASAAEYGDDPNDGFDDDPDYLDGVADRWPATGYGYASASPAGSAYFDGYDDDAIAETAAAASGGYDVAGAAQLTYSDGYEDDDPDSDAALAADGYSPAAGAELGYSDGFEDDHGQSWPDAHGLARLADTYGDGYDNGRRAGSAADDAGGRASTYGEGYRNGNGHKRKDGWAGAQALVYPAGMAEPAPLDDDTDEGYEEEGYDTIGSEYASIESLSLGSYGDEADALGLASAMGGESPPQPFTVDDRLAMIEAVAQFESGGKGYAAINPDGEFAGRFPNHAANGRYHVGLSYGIVQFTQDSGNLGRLLQMMHERDPQAFAQIFGPNADELLAVTNAPGPESGQVPGGRSARVRPVAGADLWEQPWLERFTRAGGVPRFQAAQNELAAALFIDPMLQFAGWLGLNTDRGLAMVFDRAVQMGLNGAKLWIADACGPVQTAAQRQQALAALGHADLLAFQKATPGLAQDGQWGPNSHAALTAALRRLAAGSPVPVATRDQMLDAMVRRAASMPFAKRVAHLRQSTAFHDVEYEIP